MRPRLSFEIELMAFSVKYQAGLSIDVHVCPSHLPTSVDCPATSPLDAYRLPALSNTIPFIFPSWKFGPAGPAPTLAHVCPFHFATYEFPRLSGKSPPAYKLPAVSKSIALTHLSASKGCFAGPPPRLVSVPSGASLSTLYVSQLKSLQEP